MNQSNIAVERTQRKAMLMHGMSSHFVCWHIYFIIDRQILALMIEPIKADLQLSDTQFSLLHGLPSHCFMRLWVYP